MQTRNRPANLPQLFVGPNAYSKHHAELRFMGKVLMIIDGDDAEWLAEFLAGLVIKVGKKNEVAVSNYTFTCILTTAKQKSVDHCLHYHFQSESLWHKVIGNYIREDIPRNVSVHP